jgi:uncharacterized protein YkwD
VRLLLFSAFFFLAALVGAEAQPAEPTRGPTVETSGSAFRTQVEKDTFLLINQYRKENDFPPLAWDDEIAKTARAHSKDMATGGDFGHDGFSDRISHLRETLPGIWGAGENVLYTSELNDVARRALQLWLHSPHHLKNIRGDYNHSGLGVWQDKDGTLYFTQIFVKIKPPAQETQAAPPPSLTTPFGMLANPDTRPR